MPSPVAPGLTVGSRTRHCRRIQGFPSEEHVVTRGPGSMWRQGTHVLGRQHKPQLELYTGDLRHMTATKAGLTGLHVLLLFFPCL
jgi:hypothetical protein